jgi:hypothetical protein
MTDDNYNYIINYLLKFMRIIATEMESSNKDRFEYVILRSVQERD